MDTTQSAVRLGYAQVDITPRPGGFVGFARPDNRSRDVLGCLSAQIVVWDHAGRRSALITIDSIGFAVALSAALRDAVAARLGVGRAQVMTCFTHTHAGPNVSAEPGYLAFANAQVLAGVDQALASLTPVRAAWAWPLATSA
jgi:predicted neutral ceramidase superfamily lipid hydrolase